MPPWPERGFLRSDDSRDLPSYLSANARRRGLMNGSTFSAISPASMVCGLSPYWTSVGFN